MDRFKFRAWHSEQKRMIDIYGLGPDFATENTLDGVDPGTNAFMGDDFEKLSVMQCTGLKDSEGTDVFEGDKFKGEELQEYYLVVWNVNEARFQLDYYGFDQHTGEGGQEVDSNEISRIDENALEISCISDMNVIGNIYQPAS